MEENLMETKLWPSSIQRTSFPKGNMMASLSVSSGFQHQNSLGMMFSDVSLWSLA